MRVGPLLSAILVLFAGVGAVTATRPATAAAVVVFLLSIAVAASKARIFAGLACVATVAAAYGSAAADRVVASPLTRWFEQRASSGDAGQVCWLEGTLLRDGAVTPAGVRLLVRVIRVRDDGGWRAVDGRVQAYVAGEFAPVGVREWTRGRVVRVSLVLRRPQVWRNFNRPGERWQQLQRDFDLTATIKSAALVDVSPAAAWYEAAARVRWFVRDEVHRLIGVRDPIAAAVVTAILIGDRAGLDDETERRLQMAGTYHVVAISGGNVALLTAACAVIAASVVRGYRAAALATAAVVIAYGWIVGGDPSVVRAVFAASIYLCAAAAGLRPRGLHLVATTAAILTIVDPLISVDVGAWLSFGATLGIVLIVPRLARLSAVVRWPRLATRTMQVAIALVAATIAAELSLVPVFAAVFGRLSAAGLALNFIAVPAMAAVQAAGFAAMVFAWCDPLAQLCARAAAAAARLVVDSAALVDHAPWSSWRVPPVHLGWTIVYYGSLAVMLASSPRRESRRIASAVAVCAFLVIASGAPGPRAPKGILRLVMLDVGQGDALLLQMPTGHALLVDSGGSVSAFDTGGRIVTPAVWALGTRRIEWLAITHPDQDHIGGALSVTRDLRPRELWEGIAVPRSAPLAMLRDHVRASGALWRTVRDGDGLVAGDARIEVLHPPPPDWERQKVRNDDSIVLRVRYGDVELLLTGDAGAEFESRRRASDTDARIRILKAGHHGSRTSSSPRLVHEYRPDIVLISAGRGNLYGHPAREVLHRVAGIGAAVFRTDVDGAVSVETDGRRVSVRAYAGRTWTTGVLRLF